MTRALDGDGEEEVEEADEGEEIEEPRAQSTEGDAGGGCSTG